MYQRRSYFIASRRVAFALARDMRQEGYTVFTHFDGEVWHVRGAKPIRVAA